MTVTFKKDRKYKKKEKNKKCTYRKKIRKRKTRNIPEKKKEGKKKEKNMTERRKIKIEINGKEHETYVYA